MTRWIGLHKSSVRKMCQVILTISLKLQQEQNKLVRKERSKMEREAESDRLFELKQQKKKEKHKGH